MAGPAGPVPPALHYYINEH